MIVQNARGERRVSPQAYKLLLTAHIAVSVGWLGVVMAKLALLLAAATGSDGTTAAGTPLYAAVGIIDRVFPPAAILTLLTGVVLGLGTKWGVFDYTWVVTKLVLTVAVPATAVRFGDRLLRDATVNADGLAANGGAVASAADGSLGGPEVAGTMLLALGVAHVLMLAVATIISVYKPWGKTWIGRRKGPAAKATPARVVAR